MKTRSASLEFSTWTPWDPQYCGQKTPPIDMISMSETLSTRPKRALYSTDKKASFKYVDPRRLSMSLYRSVSERAAFDAGWPLLAGNRAPLRHLNRASQFPLSIRLSTWANAQSTGCPRRLATKKNNALRSVESIPCLECICEYSLNLAF